jgi:oligopeptide/dipeptide ABC transporter ATP-binding protein
MSESLQAGSTSTETEDTILEIRDAEVSFEMARGRARVLDNVNVDIRRGETFGIIGESGCGKSTFASTLMDAVHDPGTLTGEIRYYPEDGEPIDLLDLNTRQLKRIRWEEIAIASQEAMNAFNPTLSIRRHFTETFDAHNVDRDAGLEQARERLQDLNLDPDRILDAHQHELSGGQKQRAMLALSLVFDPEVLILDEPTAGLDLLVQREILSLLYEIKDEYDLTLVFISHDIPILSGFADRISVMYAFDFVESGSVHDVLLSPKHPYTRMMLRANLDLETPIDEADTIEGETPDPINVPLGCPFHPRCPIADDRCEVEEPELRSPEGSDHELACFYPDVAVEQIPVSIGRQEDSQ